MWNIGSGDSHDSVIAVPLDDRVDFSGADMKTRNPLFLLDEIDKMATDSRGAPAVFEAADRHGWDTVRKLGSPGADVRASTGLYLIN
ncbi:hypothetical protein ACWJKU_08920 [Methylocaldum sp. MU1018]